MNRRGDSGSPSSNRPTPTYVSYTHLDVYKRQSWSQWPWCTGFNLISQKEIIAGIHYTVIDDNVSDTRSSVVLTRHEEIVSATELYFPRGITSARAQQQYLPVSTCTNNVTVALTTKLLRLTVQWLLSRSCSGANKCHLLNTSQRVHRILIRTLFTVMAWL